MFVLCNLVFTLHILAEAQIIAVRVNFHQSCCASAAPAVVSSIFICNCLFAVWRDAETFAPPQCVHLVCSYALITPQFHVARVVVQVSSNSFLLSPTLCRKVFIHELWPCALNLGISSLPEGLLNKECPQEGSLRALTTIVMFF